MQRPHLQVECIYSNWTYKTTGIKGRIVNVTIESETPRQRTGVISATLEASVVSLMHDTQGELDDSPSQGSELTYACAYAANCHPKDGRTKTVRSRNNYARDNEANAAENRDPAAPYPCTWSANPATYRLYIIGCTQKICQIANKWTDGGHCQGIGCQEPVGNRRANVGSNVR